MKNLILKELIKYYIFYFIIDYNIINYTRLCLIKNNSI
jgi:hypothetical protein